MTPRSDLLGSVPEPGGWNNHVTLPPPLPADKAAGAGKTRVESRESLTDLLEVSALPISGDQAGRLLKARLGIATSLFTALRCKHVESASHSIRVAITCSIWSSQKKLNDEERDAIEIAALLHDIGKIGLPDRILLKAAKLTDEEQAIVDRHRLMGVEILSTCCGSLKVLDIVSNAPAWYNGRRMRFQAEGEALPLGARMLAIADAYDSMTTSQVYRPARSHERAVQELFEWAGSQFDPALVQEFAALDVADRSTWTADVNRHWLYELDPITIDLQWQLNRSCIRQDALSPQELFQQRLLDNMYDAVIFVDANRQITLWNRGAERLTGLESASAYQRVFEAELIQLRNERGELCVGEDCPASTALRTCMQSVGRFLVRDRDGRDIMVDAQSIPVVGDDGMPHGVAIVLHDASGQVSLEERCLNLHQKATRDPLTQLSNRAEFDRVLALFVNVHLERRMPCSLIITDIDRFKQINDHYGHQAGDEAIKSFAQLLKAHCKAGDLAARYGGEEFVLLCANCNNSAAAERAEALRRLLGALPQSELAGAAITASFGVTELQPGDTPETMLRRADRALLLAKDTGRNKVVQLGAGIGEPQPERRKHRWWPWHTPAVAFELQHAWVTTVPLRVVVEKLRGFIADQHAEIVGTEANSVTLEVCDRTTDRRRRADRTPPVIVELRFSEEQLNAAEHEGNARLRRTRIDASIRPKPGRDRRTDALAEPATRLATSLRAYLMVNDYDRNGEFSPPREEAGTVLKWLMKE
ncbi:MAG: diguanylate cyclase [Pirellulales bacterium]